MTGVMAVMMVAVVAMPARRAAVPSVAPMAAMVMRRLLTAAVVMLSRSISGTSAPLALARVPRARVMLLLATMVSAALSMVTAMRIGSAAISSVVRRRVPPMPVPVLLPPL